MDHPSISIVTPSLNQAQFLEETLRSVLDQRYPGLEYLVIDGGSTDGSAEIIRQFSDRLAYWESKPDRGQVHAINKGLARATGEIFAFLNSDDVYLPGALAAVAAHFRARPSCRWLCGDTLFFGEGHPTTAVRSRVPRSVGQCLAWSYRAPQPGMFWRRGELGSGFQEEWSYAFDHDLYVRLLLAGVACEYLPIPLAGYRLHAASKTVAESDRIAEEFDRIAEHYEEQVGSVARRWSHATRLLRRSWSASENGRWKEAASCLALAAFTHPEGLAQRPFWGCVRRALRAGPSPK